MLRQNKAQGELLMMLVLIYLSFNICLRKRLHLMHGRLCHAVYNLQKDYRTLNFSWYYFKLVVPFQFLKRRKMHNAFILRLENHYLKINKNAIVLANLLLNNFFIDSYSCDVYKNMLHCANSCRVFRNPHNFNFQRIEDYPICVK